VAGINIAQIPFRPLLYGVLALYLVTDVALQGPVHQRFEGALGGGLSSQEKGARLGWAASVNGHPVTKAQLDLAVEVFLARRGDTRSDLSPENLKIAQLAVLDRLISDELVRLWSQAQPVDVPEDVLEDRVRQFEARFPPGKLKTLMRDQGLSRSQMQSILREHARQQHWLEEKTRPAYQVGDEEIANWHANHGETVRMPEMVRARHLFLSSVFGDLPAKERRIAELAQRLKSGEATFEPLCRKHSEDERTREIGGELGFFTRNRVPQEFADVVFGLEPGTIHGPFETSLGWHVVEVLERIPARPVPPADLRPEVVAFLENAWRSRAVERLLDEELRIPRRARVEIFAPAMVLSRNP